MYLLRQPQHFHSSHPVLKPTPAPSPPPPSQLRMQAAGCHIIHLRCISFTQKLSVLLVLTCVEPHTLHMAPWWHRVAVAHNIPAAAARHGTAQHTRHVSTLHKRQTTLLLAQGSQAIAADTMSHQPHHTSVSPALLPPPSLCVRPETPAALSSRCRLPAVCVSHRRTHCDAVLPLLTSRQHMRSTITSPPSSSFMYSSIT